MGAVAWAIRQRSVSHPRSSNRTCRSPASGSPTGFTARYTESKLTARGFGTVNNSPSPLDTAISAASGIDGVCRLIANHHDLANFESTFNCARFSEYLIAPASANTRATALVCGIVERAADGVVDGEVIVCNDAAGVGERGRIRNGWAGCDRGSIVVGNVRDRERHDLGALPGARQPPALDARQMLTDGIHFADRRAGAEQGAGHLLLQRNRDDALEHQERIVGMPGELA